MNTVTAHKILLSSAALLAVALNAHANPRGVESADETSTVDALPVQIELSTDTLLDSSAPVIDIDDIDAFDVTLERQRPATDAWSEDDYTGDHAGTDAHSQPFGSDPEWHAESPDLDAELPTLDFDSDFDDDVRMPEMDFAIDTSVPAPAISLDF